MTTNPAQPQEVPIWKERFFVPMVISAQVARGNPTRGLAVTTAAGGQGQRTAARSNR